MSLFKNAAPMFYSTGADDKSIRNVSPEPAGEPQHLPLCLLFTKKGPTQKVLVTDLETIYDSDSFNVRSKYFTHQSRFAVEMLGNGNTLMCKRLIPKDAGPRANMALYLDVIEADVPNYVRNSKGDLVVVPESNSYKVDSDAPTVPGYYVKVIKEFNRVTNNKHGLLTSKVGTMTFTKDVKQLNHAIKLTHYAYRVQPDEVYTNIGTTKEKYIADTMPGNVERWKTAKYSELRKVITDAEAIIRQYNSFPENAPKSSYEVLEETKKSTMYPIIELTAKEHGEAYNNNGISINTLYGEDLDQEFVGKNKALQFGLSLWTRKDKNSSPEYFKTLFSETEVKFSFKQNSVDPLTEAVVDLEKVFDENWYNEKDPLKTTRYFEYDPIYVYRDNFEFVNNLLLEKEREYVTTEYKTWDDGLQASTIGWYDFTTADQELIKEETYVINPFTCKSSKNKRYFAVQIGPISNTRTETQREVTLSNDTPVFLEGATDGTMTKESYEELVIDYIKEYSDPDSETQDLSFSTESIFYDSGLSLENKKLLSHFIKLRKDTSIVVSTHDAALGQKVLPLSDQRAIGVALRTAYKLAPESTINGTGVCRAMIVVGAGKLNDNSTKDYVPLTFEIASKASKMMGASNGKWNMAYLFDNAENEGNVIKKLIEIQPEFVPNGIKPTLWNDGLCWAQRFDRQRYHFPALQTVYENDTSVLKSFFNMIALCYCDRCGYKAWKTFTGTVNLTDGQFIDKVQEFMRRDLEGRFGNMITAVPRVEIVDRDKLLGYSWRSYIDMSGNNMKTVAVHTTRVYRASDAEQK